MNTIRLGSTGPDVVTWQKVLGVTADGSFGPATDTATKAYQKQKGLVVDGVVGPASWAVAFPRKATLPAVAQLPAADPNNVHVRNKALVDSLGVTPNESNFMRRVGYHETKYGLGWGGAAPPDGGNGSWNMGAITTPTGKQTSVYDFHHGDSRNDGNGVIQYTTWFAGYPNALEGWKGLARTLLKPNVKAALAKNDFNGAVAAMYANKYYLGIHPRTTPEGNAANVNDYLKATTKAFTTFSQYTGEKIAENGSIIAKVAAVVGIVILFVVGRAVLLRS